MQTILSTVDQVRISDKVWYVRSQNQVVAEKILHFPRDQRDLEEAMRRQVALQLAMQPLTGLVAHHIDLAGPSVSLAFEWCDYGSLLDIARQTRYTKRMHFPAEFIGLVAIQMIHSLVALESQGLLHRAIQPDHILVNQNGGIRLCGFSLARRNDNTNGLADTVVGASPSSAAHFKPAAYIAPERIKAMKYGPESEIYSLGLVLYYLATLSHPFEGVSDGELSSRCIQGLGTNLLGLFRAAGRPTGSEQEEQLEELVLSCLTMDPTTRPRPLDLLGCELLCCLEAPLPGEPMFAVEGRLQELLQEMKIEPVV